jgi:phenylacetate-CoA ligase
MEFGLGQLLQARPKAMRRRIWSALARRAIARAEAFDPEAVARATEARALASFRRTARAVPAYRSLLRESCVDPRQIVTIGDFHRLVPVVSKERLFDSYRLAALVANGRIGDGTLVFTSSGYSGSFSFGVETAQQTSTLTERIDALLDYYFRVCSKRTLIVNALPGGVRIPTRAALVAELGPRPEAVLRVLEGLGSDLEQIVLVAEPLLAKELAEQARERCFDLAGLRVSAIVGGEFVADSFRRYLAPLLGGELFTSFGISELGLSLAHDTAELRRVASALARDRELRSRVLDGAPFAPELLQYYPDQYYLETPELDGRRSLVATTLDPERLLPLVRYRSGDWAEVLPGGALAERLARAGHPELAPASRLPVLAVYGRGTSLEASGRRCYPEQIKSALFEDPELARLVTGRFRLELGKRPLLRVECRHHELPDVRLRQRLVPELEHHAAMELEVSWEPRGEAGFSGGFERKQRYVE